MKITNYGYETTAIDTIYSREHITISLFYGRECDALVINYLSFYL